MRAERAARGVHLPYDSTMPSRRLRSLALLVAATAALTAAPFGLRRAETHAIANPPPSLPSVEVAIVATPHVADARTSDVRKVTIDAAGAHDTTLATIPHAPGAVVRGDVLRDGAFAVVVAADEESARDRDWGSALWRVDANGARFVARGVYHASRPLASVDGNVYVQRGASGAWPTADEAKRGKLRTDALSIDAIDPDTGASRTLHTWSGYTLHVAGEWQNELVVYRVAFEGADIVAIDRASGAVRSLASVVPFARDFSIDARGALWMSNRDDVDANAWIVARLDLATGAVTRVAVERGESLAPFALPDGTVAWTASGRKGLAVATKLGAVATRPLAPLGAGYDSVTAASGDAAWATIAHVPASGYDVAAAVHVASGTPVRLTPRDERVSVLGFVDGANGGAR